MSDTFELIGQRALVTGGTKGIGEAVAARLRELVRRFSPPRAPGPTSFRQGICSWLRMSPPPKAARLSPAP